MLSLIVLDGGALPQSETMSFTDAVFLFFWLKSFDVSVGKFDFHGTSRNLYGTLLSLAIRGRG